MFWRRVKFETSFKVQWQYWQTLIKTIFFLEFKVRIEQCFLLWLFLLQHEFSTVDDSCILHRPIFFVGVELFDFSDDLFAADHLTEHDVDVVQVRSDSSCDEKLSRQNWSFFVSLKKKFGAGDLTSKFVTPYKSLKFG